jgi:N-acyl-D-amino-acid deacylase
MYDLLLKNGRIYDGSGMPSFIADLAIRDGRIAAIGRINEAATRVLDADGLAVAPGIVDFHTHFDAQIWWDPLGSSSNEHGVTTVVMGNCGLTLVNGSVLMDSGWHTGAYPGKVLRSQAT